jgi:hypothetical protein
MLCFILAAFFEKSRPYFQYSFTHVVGRTYLYSFLIPLGYFRSFLFMHQMPFDASSKPGNPWKAIIFKPSCFGILGSMKKRKGHLGMQWKRKEQNQLFGQKFKGPYFSITLDDKYSWDAV